MAKPKYTNLGVIDFQPSSCAVDPSCSPELTLKDVAPVIKVKTQSKSAPEIVFSGGRPGRFNITPAIEGVAEIWTRRQDNVGSYIKVRPASGPDEPECFFLQPGSRAMVPIGVQFECPTGYTIKLNSAPNLAFDFGTVVIDSCLAGDRINIVNNSTRIVQIWSDSVIAEGEVVRVEQLKME